MTAAEEGSSNVSVEAFSISAPKAQCSSYSIFVAAAFRLRSTCDEGRCIVPVAQ